MENHLNVSILQDTGTSLLTSKDGIITTTDGGQFVSFAGINLTGLGGVNSSSLINVPIISDGNILSGSLGSHNLVLATAADGSRTFLIDANQLALITQVASSFPEENSNSLSQPILPDNVPLTSDPDDPTISLLVGTVTAPPQGDDYNPDKISSLVDSEEIQPPLKKGVYKCDSCSKEFKKYSQYLRHQKLHLDDKPFRCPECDISFNFESNLKLHASTHCKENPTCPECGKLFSRVASLKAHIMLHEKEESIVCLECGDEFSTQRHMDKHLKQHVEESKTDKFYACRHCSQKFIKPVALRDHMKIHVRLRASLHHRPHKKNIDRSSFSHKCEHCEKIFQKPSQLLRHKRIHTGERPFKCDTCDKAFNQKGALDIHKTKHTGEKPFKCEFCIAAFSQRGNLRNHIKRVHTLALEPNQTRYQCMECSCVFRKIGNLNAHLSKMHSSTYNSSTTWHKVNEDSDVRDEGQRVIKQLMELSQHVDKDDKNKENESSKAENSDILQQAIENSGLTTDPKEKEKQCKSNATETTENTGPKAAQSILKTKITTAPIMMQIADISGILKRHIVRKVGGIVWHQCLYCTKEFKKPSDLVRHIRIHTHEKPYKCHQCFRSFAVTSTLKAHIKVHMGIKDFCCPVCKKFFASQGSLKVHNRLHTGAKPFPCSICDRKFRTSGHRKSHMLSHNKKTSVRKKRERNPNSKDKPIISTLPPQEPILITDAGLVQPSPRNNLANRGREDTESGDRPYQCPSCLRGFKKSSHLKQHFLSHTGEKPFRCDTCQKCFVSNGALKAHILTHTRAKNFKCQVCNTQFTTNGSLKRHMSTHSSERPYMCPYCQKTFKTAMDCKKHMKTHRPKMSISNEGGGSQIEIHQDDGEHSTEVIRVIMNESTESQNGEVVDDPIEADLDSSKENLVKITGEGFEAIVNAENDEDGTTLVSLAPETITLNSQTFTCHQEILTTNNLQTLHGSLNFDGDGEEIIDAPDLDQSQFMSHFTSGNFTITVPADQIEGLGEAFNINPSLITANMEAILSCKDGEAKATLSGPLEGLELDQNLKYAMPTSLGTKRPKKTYKCDYCQKFFKKLSHLKQHARIHTGERPYSCQHCARMFSSTSVLNAHVKTHSGVKDYKCQICESAFTTNASLVRHMHIHSKDALFNCSVCGKGFRNKFVFYKHTKGHCGEEGQPGKKKRPNLITISPSQAEEIAKLTLPETASVSEKVLIASAAEKDRISELKDKYVEIQKQPAFSHMCPHCPKSFKKPSDLTRHIRTHTGERPYPCHLCNKSFTVKSTLDCHLKTHTGQKNFDCHVCNSFFATKGSLKVHMRLHTGSKPFKCPHCDLRFRTSGHRKSHIATHFRHLIKKKPLRDFAILDETSEEEEEEELPSKSMEATMFESNDDDVLKNESGENSTSVQGIDGIQFQIPPSLLGQNIQIPGMEPSMFHMDPKFLQQLQGGANVNVTITPNILPDSNSDENSTNLNTSENGDQFLQSESGAPLLGLTSHSLVNQLNALGLSMDQAQLIANVNEANSTSSNPPFHVSIDQGEKSVSENDEGEADENDEEEEEEEEPAAHEEPPNQTLDLNGGNEGAGELIDNMLRDIRSPSKEPANHKCLTCGKAFQRRSLLERHLRIHTGEKPFACTECPKTFNQKNTLQIHLAKHAGYKPWKCEHCHMAFTQKGNLKTHMKRAHR